jgi:hypothetical protein
MAHLVGEGAEILASSRLGSFALVQEVRQRARNGGSRLLDMLICRDDRTADIATPRPVLGQGGSPSTVPE